MGCDIHLYTEFLKDGRWQTGDIWRKSKYDEPGETTMDTVNRFEAYSDRHYNFFAWLADVRNGTWGEAMPVICQPKGMPSDCCAEIRAACERWDADGHSHSWLTLEELEKAWERDEDIPVAFHGAVDDEDPKIQAWLALPVGSRGAPDSFCASGGSYDRPYPRAKWAEPVSKLIGPAYAKLRGFLWDLKWDEQADDVRCVFWFDN